MKNLTAEEVIDWVDRNARLIQGHARKYLPFAPYDQEDFLQDAYEAALLAAEVASKRKLSFPACFWITFKGKISEVTPYPGSNRHAGSASPPTTMYRSSDFFDLESTTSEPPINIDIDRVYQAIRAHLTPVESKVLSRALGIHSGRQAIREIARELECSPANVRQALNRCYRRISELVQSGKLQIELKDVEPRHLAAINGTGRNQVRPETEAGAVDAA